MEYAALTAAEEQAGLYRDPSRIGLRLYWHTLLKRLGLSHDGHKLIELEKGSSTIASEARSDARGGSASHGDQTLRLIEAGQRPCWSVDCCASRRPFSISAAAMGWTSRPLSNLGYQASGWDPAFRPNAEKQKATVVNLGYVLNVIEEPARANRCATRGLHSSREAAHCFHACDGTGDRCAFAALPRWLPH